MAKTPKKSKSEMASGHEGLGPNLAEALLRKKLEGSLPRQSSAAASQKAPTVQAPSLEGLEVAVRPIEPPSQQDLIDYFTVLRLEHAARKPRKAGEHVHSGDEVVIDLIGSIDGKPIPGSAHIDTTLIIGIGDPLLPGFVDKLIGCQVGKPTKIKLTLPKDYFVKTLQRKTVDYAVTVKAANALTVPDSEDAAFLNSLKLGNSLQEIFENIAIKIIETRRDELSIESTNLVLDQLLARANVDLPDSLIDEEIRALWEKIEGETVAKLGLTKAQQKHAMNGWIADADLRADVKRRLGISLVLVAVTNKENLLADPKDLNSFVEQTATELGLDVSEVKRTLAQDASMRDEMLRNYAHLRTVDFVMSHAKVNVAQR